MGTRTPYFLCAENKIWAVETLWGVLSGAEKAPAGMGTRTLYFGCTKNLTFSPKQFWLRNNPGACILGRKKPLRAWGHALSIFDTQKTFIFSPKITTLAAE